MTPRERNGRLDTRVDVLRRSYAAGEYLDQFTTVPAVPPEVTLARLPKCLMRKEANDGSDRTAAGGTLQEFGGE